LPPVTDLSSSLPGTLAVLGRLRDGIGSALGWLGSALEDSFWWLVHALGNSFRWLVDALGGSFWWLVGAGDWLWELLGPAREILAGLWPSVAAAAAAIVLLRTFRWLLLLWRGRTPRVQISTFAWAASDNGDREATWVTSLFREQLAALRLDALDPLPERAPGAPLVEIVEGVGQGVGRSLDIGRAAGKLFRAILPDAAYEVWGTLRPHEEGGGRISVQLVDRSGGNRTLLNVALEETAWEDGAREAAMAVAGALYPRVRRHDRGPWTMWDKAVPRGLMADYHEAREHEEANRLEHALERYHAALDQDPLNPNLRLKIAMLQERLELDLDAWVTYEAIVDESDRRAWRGPDRRVYLLAHYRLAILLGSGRVSKQWVKNNFLGKTQGTRRDQERRELRQELLMSLRRNRLFEKIGSSSRKSPLVTASAKSLIAELAGSEGRVTKTAMLNLFCALPWASDEEGRLRARQIDAVLQVVSLRHLEELDAWLRVRPPWPRQWRKWWIHRPAVRQLLGRREFARAAVRTSKLLVRIRVLASLERGYLDFSSPDEKKIIAIRKAHVRLTKRWPFPAVGIRRHVTHFLAPRRRWTNHRDDAWQLHYNAACTGASVLREDSILSRAEDESVELRNARGQALSSDDARKKVVAKAIAELEDYAYRAGSARVAAQADWLAIDDPDLEGLRKKAAFRLWASHHLPRKLSPDQPKRMNDVRRFTIRVIHQGARAFADVWRQRADSFEAPASEITVWWREERRAWEVLRTSCREHLSWGERLNGLKALQAWLHVTGKPDVVDFGHETRGDTPWGETMSDDLLDRLVDLVGDRWPPTIVGKAPTVLPWVAARFEHVRTAYAEGERLAGGNGSLLAVEERREALRAFQIWTGIADALAAELREPPPEGEATSLEARLRHVRDQLPGTESAGVGG
jgi:hypothetical protein